MSDEEIITNNVDIKENEHKKNVEIQEKDEINNTDSEDDDDAVNKPKVSTPKFNRKKLERQSATCEGMVVLTKEELQRIKDGNNSTPKNQENNDGIFGFLIGLCCAQNRDGLVDDEKDNDDDDVEK